MRKPGQETGKPDTINITAHDVVFECPACSKGLVVDEAAVGLTVECPRCHINVIVPPKQIPTGPQLGPPPPADTRSKKETTLLTPPFKSSVSAKTEPATPPPPPVPPAETKPNPAAGAQAASPTATGVSKSEVAALQQRLAKLADQVKELQTQRTELMNRVASRINDMNNDLVLLARVETSHQQVLSEWNEIVNQLGALARSGESAAAPTTVLGASSGSGRTRVSF